MLGPEMNAGLAAAPVQSCLVVVAVAGPDLGETLPSLKFSPPLQRKSQPADPGFVVWVEGWCADYWLCLFACSGCSVVSKWRKLS